MCRLTFAAAGSNDITSWLPLRGSWSHSWGTMLMYGSDSLTLLNVNMLQLVIWYPSSCGNCSSKAYTYKIKWNKGTVTVCVELTCKFIDIVLLTWYLQTGGKKVHCRKVYHTPLLCEERLNSKEAIVCINSKVRRLLCLEAVETTVFCQ